MQKWINSCDRKGKAMRSKSIVEEEYRKILQGIKRLPDNDSVYGTKSFQALLKPDYLTRQEKSLKELQDAVSGLAGKKDFLQDWSNIKEMDKLGEVLDPFKKLIPPSPLVKLEEKTYRLADMLSMEKDIPRVSEQLSVMNALSDGLEDKWKKLVLPDSFLSDYERLAENQYKAIQKAIRRDDFNIDSRLGILGAASKFVDRQVDWTRDFLTTVRTQIEEDDGEEVLEPPETPTTLSKIPQYIAYTGRKDVHITAEEGLEKSVLVEVTEMGKRIMEKAVIINRLCEAKNKDKFFKPTDKLVISAVEIATITCTSREELGKVIDALYFLLYENLERIKKVVTDNAVRNETVYHCIFAVKSIRTDFRHDFEHGKEQDIKKKQKAINDCYKRYCSKIPLKQKDFILLQKNLFQDILTLEEHLTDKLEELQEPS